MGKTKLIAISGICAAVAVVCMLLCSVAFWAVLMLSVIASIAAVIPLLIAPKGLTYSLLIYAVSSVLGGFSAVALGNIVYVAPIVAFGMPFAIVKVYGETVSFSAQLDQKQTFEDPFGNGEDTHVMQVQLKGKKRLNPIVKWVLYYVLLEVAIGLTLLAAYLFTKPLFDQIVSNDFFYLLLAALQLIVIPYDLLMRGCLIGIVKILHKVIR
ncbi:MAG: hypothetical protein J1F66_03495 [Clostridiales bacterium]|nr:hypothetical protein [Clostridiales bacterium]